LEIPLENDAEYCQAVQSLHFSGVVVVALYRGAQGIILSANNKLIKVTPPPVSVRSPGGAEEAALAGMLWSVMDGCSPAHMAARAVACGTATAMQEATEFGDRTLVEIVLGEASWGRLSLTKNGI